MTPSHPPTTAKNKKKEAPFTAFTPNPPPPRQFVCQIPSSHRRSWPQKNAPLWSLLGHHQQPNPSVALRQHVKNLEGEASWNITEKTCFFFKLDLYMLLVIYYSWELFWVKSYSVITCHYPKFLPPLSWHSSTFFSSIIFHPDLSGDDLEAINEWISICLLQTFIWSERAVWHTPLGLLILMAWSSPRLRCTRFPPPPIGQKKHSHTPPNFNSEFTPASHGG